MVNIMERLNQNKIELINNPVILENLFIIRNKTSDSSQVRLAARKITRILLYEASKSLPLVKKNVTTPLTSFKTEIIDPEIKIVISPILTGIMQRNR